MKPVLPDSDPAASKDCVFEAVGEKKELDGGQVQTLHGVDFQIAKGEFVAVIGPSAVVERLRCSRCSAHSTSPAGEPYHRGEHRRQMQGLKNKADLAGAVGQWIGQIGNRVSAIVRLLKSVGADHR